jgi:uncharacterized protein
MTSASSDSQELGPVQARERIFLLDVVRGFAILGMFYSHWGGTYHPDLRDLDHGLLQETVIFIRRWLIVGKFYPLFALLMGVGMGIQIGRAEEVGRNIVPIYLRRLFFLYFLGWFGSFFIGVSQLYALAAAGVVTFFIGYVLRQHRRLLLAVICWFFLSSTIPYVVQWYEREPPETPTAEQVEERRLSEEERRVRFEELSNAARRVSSPFYDSETFQVFLDRRLSNPIPRPFRSLEDLVASDWELILFMLIGFFVWQVGLFKRIGERKRLFVYLLFVSIFVGSWEWTWDEVLTPGIQPGVAGVLSSFIGSISPMVGTLATIAIDLAYISAFALLISVARPARLLQKLAPAGRLAFTNFVLNFALPPILFPLLFGWWIPGIASAEMALKVTVVFALMVLFSTMWLKRFRFGPFEWLWRSLTYWKLQPMRVERPAAKT